MRQPASRRRYRDGVARYFATTPIYYVNDVPHMGHAYTTLSGDALCRWRRLHGDEVFYLTGTDEHGLKVQRAAEQNGLTPQEQADRTSRRFRAAWDLLDIAYDDFIRTTEPRHHTAVQTLLERCYENGYVYKDSYQGAYCVSCEAYYAEADLIDGDCPIHEFPVEQMSEDNYFFRLSAFRDRLLEWFEAVPDNITPERYRNEARALVRGGLEDLSITRTSLDWGIPVPWDRKHVFYVWYDALTNYATAAGYGTDDERFATWWPAVRHLLGKDIIRFHCVYWPAMLMAAGVEPLPRFHVHGWLLVSGAKMAKTSVVQIAPADLAASLGVDGLRYSVLRDNPFGPDSDFSYEALVQRCNSDLANGLGNLLQRVTTIVARSCGSVGSRPAPGSSLGAVAARAYEATAAAWDRVQPSVALEETWRIVRETNEYLQAHQPWKLDPGPELDAVLGDALEALRIVAVLAHPAMPRSCAEVWRRIGLDGDPSDARLPEAVHWGQYPGGLTVEVGDPLFPRLSVD